MNLEQLAGELVRIADSIEYNNKNHSGLNEDILTTPPSPECGINAKEELIYQETGILAIVENAVKRLDYLVGTQSRNIGRTRELINFQDVPQQCDAVLRY